MSGVPSSVAPGPNRITSPPPVAPGPVGLEQQPCSSPAASWRRELRRAAGDKRPIEPSRTVQAVQAGARASAESGGGSPGSAPGPSKSSSSQSARGPAATGTRDGSSRADGPGRVLIRLAVRGSVAALQRSATSSGKHGAEAPRCTPGILPELWAVVVGRRPGARRRRLQPVLSPARYESKTSSGFRARSAGGRFVCPRVRYRVHAPAGPRLPGRDLKARAPLRTSPAKPPS